MGGTAFRTTSLLYETHVDDGWVTVARCAQVGYDLPASKLIKLVVCIPPPPPGPDVSCPPVRVAQSGGYLSPLPVGTCHREGHCGALVGVERKAFDPLCFANLNG